MTEYAFNPDAAAIREASRVVEPLLRAKQEARIAADQADVDYLAAWHQAYRDAQEQGF